MKPEGWKLGSAIIYNAITPKIIPIGNPKMDDKDFERCGSSFSSMTKTETFEISYLERRYILR
jgi:hypothetical protein